ncbi:MAG: RluA family pseudouridine synthase [Planctomycetota bacterium]|nr:RluA family pseudouridine synthase [Planctomycetota bacterium]
MNQNTKNWQVQQAGRALQAEIHSQMEIPHRRAKDIIRRGGVKVAGHVVMDPGFRLSAGDAIEANPEPMKLRTAQRQLLSKGLEVLHKDRHVIVVNKPAGLLTVPTDEDEREICLLGEISRKLRKEGEKRPALFVVQRLDRGTSGVIAIARTPDAREGLRRQLKSRKMERRYLAISQGKSSFSEGIVTKSLSEDPRTLKMRISHKDDDGIEAITRWKKLHVQGDHQLIEARLETGRRNQIRVHLASIGLPIIGDTRYGVSSPWIDRPALHAETIAFHHPISQQELSFQVGPPEDFMRALEATSIPAP